MISCSFELDFQTAFRSDGARIDVVSKRRHISVWNDILAETRLHKQRPVKDTHRP